jgi:lactoylglutathione lyase
MLDPCSAILHFLCLNDFILLPGVRFTPGGIRKGASGHDVTFIHPKGDANYPIGGGGVLIELVQAPDSLKSKPIG